MWKIIWALWFGCTLSNWIGSIFGWGLWPFNWGTTYPHVQAFGYLLWKVIGFIMLNLMVYILFEIKHIIKQTIIIWEKMEATDSEHLMPFELDELKRGYIRIKRLIIFELLLSFFLFINVIYETYVIICIYKGVLFTNIYAESTVMQMIVYFPLWTSIHVVLLVYSWVPKVSMIPPATRIAKAIMSNSSLNTSDKSTMELQETRSSSSVPKLDSDVNSVPDI